MRKPNRAVAKAPAGKARMKGRWAFNIRVTVPYAPMAKKPACPREIWPVYPTRMLRPIATMTLMAM